MRKLHLLMMAAGAVAGHAPLLHGAPTHSGGPSVSAKPAKNQPDLNGQYEGVIGKNLKVRLLLQRQGTVLTGSYRYLKAGGELRLMGTTAPTSLLTMREFDASGRQTGLFEGRLVMRNDGTSSITGTWSKPNGKGVLPFRATEIIANFAGEWTFPNDPETEASFDLTLRQKGRQLSGEHCVITARAARIDCASANPDNTGIPTLTGTVNGQIATVKFKSTYGVNAGGTARITRHGNRITWQIIESHGEHFFPPKVTLQKIVPQKSPTPR
jgi:hypothetical protein